MTLSEFINKLASIESYEEGVPEAEWFDVYLKLDNKMEFVTNIIVNEKTRAIVIEGGRNEQ